MSANLITGNLFKPIYAYQDADYQAGISGNVTSIMPVGSQMALSIEDANTIKADDGVLITKEGRRIQIDAGAIEEWSIPTGTQGQTNYFIIGFHLYTDSNSAEVCETFVEQMENATDTISENTFRSGATEVYISLGRVVQNGINLESATSLVQIAQSFEDVKNAITQLNNDLGSKSSASAVTGNDAFSKIATLKNEVDKKEPSITSKLDGWIGRVINVPITLGSTLNQSGGLLIRVNFQNGGNDNIYIPNAVLKYATANMQFTLANNYLTNSNYYGRAEVTYNNSAKTLTLTHQEKGSSIGSVTLDVYIYI